MDEKLMDQIVQLAGWSCLAFLGAATIASIAVPLLLLFKRARPPQVAGAKLSVLDSGLDLSKFYDIAYGASNGYTSGAGIEKLCGVRIVGYLRGEQDATSGEYSDSRWLVVELPDGRRGYIRPRSVLWIIESKPAEEHESPATQ
jgi:hypothetical protein